jgi:membrane protease YdiL (CAAX protease family)
MNIKNTIRNLSPFNDRQDMPTAQYIIKKVLAFFFIYLVAAVLGEAIIIGALCAMGYDPLNGVMPTGYLADLLPNYGMILFIAVAVFYCKKIEKRGFKKLGFCSRVFDYVIGGVVAIVLLAVITCVCCVSGVLTFEGVGTTFDPVYLLALFGSFVIQSMSEEVLSRGYLFNALRRKTGITVATLVSSAAFMLPHLPSMLDGETVFVVLGVVNLLLVSTAFTLLYVLRSNIYIVGGLHCIWNFILSGVMGLTLSGGSGSENAVLNFRVNGENLLTGGIYGLEASLVTTAILSVAVIILVKCYEKRGFNHGI